MLSSAAACSRAATVPRAVARSLGGLSSSASSFSSPRNAISLLHGRGQTPLANFSTAAGSSGPLIDALNAYVTCHAGTICLSALCASYLGMAYLYGKQVKRDTEMLTRELTALNNALQVQFDTSNAKFDARDILLDSLEAKMDAKVDTILNKLDQLLPPVNDAR